MTDQIAGSIHSTLVDSKDPSESTTNRVVFLHGLFGRGKNFSRIAAGLLPEAQSLLVDLPNHGRSGWTEHFDYFQIADLVAEHVRTEFADGKPIDLVGHSMGGKVAMVLALRHPDLVRRLVVVDISPTRLESLSNPHAASAARGEFPHLLNSLASVDLTKITRRADANAALQDNIPNDSVRSFLLQNLERTANGFAWEPNLNLLRRDLDTIMSFPDMTGASFNHPTLWIRGDRSSYVTDDDSAGMRLLFPKTVRVTIRGASHWVHSDKSEETIAALRGFLLAP